MVNLAKGGERAERILLRRQAHRRMLKFCSDVMKWQDARGACFIAENPQQSQAWSLPEFRWLFNHNLYPHIKSWITDMCQYNLRDPVTGFYYRKATRLVANVSDVSKHLSKRCCDATIFPHTHQVIEGRTTHQGKCIARSEFAGWYTHEFCTFLLRGFEEYFWWEPTVRKSGGKSSIQWLTVTSEPGLKQLFPADINQCDVIYFSSTNTTGVSHFEGYPSEFSGHSWSDPGGYNTIWTVFVSDLPHFSFPAAKRKAKSTPTRADKRPRFSPDAHDSEEEVEDLP